MLLSYEYELTQLKYCAFSSDKWVTVVMANACSLQIQVSGSSPPDLKIPQKILKIPSHPNTGITHIYGEPKNIQETTTWPCSELGRNHKKINQIENAW